jgi:hypothetical protein
MSNKGVPPKTPEISFLDPKEVPANWEGAVKIVGSNFDKGSFALFNGAVPQTAFISDSVLEAAVTTEITKQAGTKDVLVHTSEGLESNTLPFIVK